MIFIKIITAICCGFVGLLVLALIAKSIMAIIDWLF